MHPTSAARVRDRNLGFPASVSEHKSDKKLHKNIRIHSKTDRNGNVPIHTLTSTSERGFGGPQEMVDPPHVGTRGVDFSVW